MKPRMTITKDITAGLMAAIESLKHKETLVGIPEDKNGRKAEDGEKPEIGNAALMAIHEYGSPANNIPERPVMRIGLWDSRPEVTEQFKQAALAVLSKGQSAFDVYLERAGIIASNRIKFTINNQIDIAPPEKSTIAARRRPGFNGRLHGFMGTKALIVTGQLRNSITYVVRSKKWL